MLDTSRWASQVARAILGNYRVVGQDGFRPSMVHTEWLTGKPGSSYRGDHGGTQGSATASYPNGNLSGWRGVSPSSSPSSHVNQWQGLSAMAAAIEIEPGLAYGVKSAHRGDQDAVCCGLDWTGRF